MAKLTRPTAKSSENNALIYAFLKSEPVGVLATINKDGSPQAAVIYYSIRDDFTIAFTTKSDTRKHANLQRDSRVMLVVYDPRSQTTAQIVGKAIEVDGKNAKDAEFRNMMRSSMKTSQVGVPPLFKLEAGLYVTYRIKPLLITMAVFARPDPGGYEMYQAIIF